MKREMFEKKIIKILEKYDIDEYHWKLEIADEIAKLRPVSYGREEIIDLGEWLIKQGYKPQITNSEGKIIGPTFQFVTVARLLQEFATELSEVKEKRIFTAQNLTDNEIKEWALYISQTNFSYTFYDGLIDGAKAALSGQIAEWVKENGKNINLNKK